MKRIVILIFALALLLCGCGNSSEPVVAEPPVTTPEPTETTAPAVASEVSYEAIVADSKEHAVLTGITSSGEVVWTYETAQYDLAQLSSISDIGQWQQQYYIVSGGAVVALDVETGEVLWENADFGGAPASKEATYIDEDGSVYVCGYFGPDFYAVSAAGETLLRVTTFDANYYWAYKLVKEDGNMAVHFSGDVNHTDAEDSEAEDPVAYVVLPLA